MKLTGPQITTVLRENLQIQSGRHLYGVLGKYAQLEAFELDILSHASLSTQEPSLHNDFPIPKVINLNFALLETIGDQDLKDLVASEGKRPLAIQRRLNLTFDNLLAKLFASSHFIILKQIEMLFAYDLDLQTIRARATNQNHIMLLLPGEKRGDHVALFTEASARFHRELPFQLIADNHLWELENGKIA